MNTLFKSIPILTVLFAASAYGIDTPDKLYREGRFSEAEAAYSELDMDRPKKLRYRYNRGCAAYQNDDYQGAGASFSSVLRRTKDDTLRFRAAFNLGNTAFKKGDFQSAAPYFKQAIKLNPQSEESRYNLELTLREIKKQKEQADSKKDGPPDNPSGQKEDKEEGAGSGEQGSKKEPDQKEESSPKESEGKEETKKESAPGPGRDEENQDSRQGDTGGQKPQEDPPKDLSGKLRGQNAMPTEEGEMGPDADPRSLVNKKKAEALLDNIQEDRSKVLRFQIPREKRDGVPSGKDW